MVMLCNKRVKVRFFSLPIALCGMALLAFTEANAGAIADVAFPQMRQYYSGVDRAEGTAFGDSGVALRSVYCMIHYYSIGDYTYRYWNWTTRTWQIGSTIETMKKADFDAATGAWQCSGDFPTTWEPSLTVPGVSEPSRTYALDVLAYDTDTPTSIRAAGIAYFYIDNVLPTITAPAGVTVDQLGPEGTPADQVDLGIPTVADPCDPNPIVTNDAPAVFPPGRTLVTWTATDRAGNASMASQTVYVADSQPPSIHLTVLKETLHPANNKMVLAAEVTVVDACDPAPHVAIQVSANSVLKAAKGGKGGKVKPDWEIVQNGDLWQIWLRATTDGRRTTRVYTIEVQATDAAGNAATASDTVTVLP